MSKSKILIFVRYYLPGYKSGGPVISISQFIKKLEKYANFYIITSNRDFLDRKAYKSIKTNNWNRRFNVLINYLDNNYFQYFKIIIRTLSKNKIETIYFSSLFDFKFTIFPLLLIRIFIIRKKRLIVAPRGELYSGALSIKKKKKYFFLRLAKFINLFRNIIWHATSKEEKIAIKKIFPNSTVIISLNFYASLKGINQKKDSMNKDNELKIIYYSRITPKKNLKYCIEILNKVSTKYKLDIYGPVDDTGYWGECEKFIIENGLSHLIRYQGVVRRDEIAKTLSRYDLFIFPTLGENFGHVIFDAINSGIPVLLSNKTPWKSIDKYSIGWSVPLENKQLFIKIINTFRTWELDHKENFSKNAEKFLIENFNMNDVTMSYKKLFNF